VITALRKDASGSIPNRTRLHWEAFLADASARASFDLRYLNRLIQPREAIWAIEQFFLDLHDTDDKPSAPQASAEA
jgi:hypothetical protein